MIDPAAAATLRLVSSGAAAPLLSFSAGGHPMQRVIHEAAGIAVSVRVGGVASRLRAT